MRGGGGVVVVEVLIAAKEQVEGLEVAGVREQGVKVRGEVDGLAQRANRDADVVQSWCVHDGSVRHEGSHKDYEQQITGITAAVPVVTVDLSKRSLSSSGHGGVTFKLSLTEHTAS
jgi:hypothetical protein